MKKVLAIVLSALLLVAALVGCASKSEPASTETASTDTAASTDGKLETLKVGASSTPHAEILEQVKDTLAAEGYDLQIVIYDDYVLPNQSLADGSLDANYFQHTPYLNSFNASTGTDLVSAAKIHYEPFGLYGNGVASVADIAADATILIPADDSNETRALLLLAQEGLIELPADASAEKGVTTLDIVDAKGHDVQPLQADTVPAQLANSNPGTVAVINGNYALQAGERRRRRGADLRQHHCLPRRRRKQRQDPGTCQGAPVRRCEGIHRKDLQRRCCCDLLILTHFRPAPIWSRAVSRFGAAVSTALGTGAAKVGSIPAPRTAGAALRAW